MTDSVFLDTETTGLHPERRPWEIAMIKTTEQEENKDLESEDD